MASRNQAAVARDERGPERPHRARAIDDAGRAKVAAIRRRAQHVTAATVDTGSAAPSNDIDPTLRRWMPLMVPLLAALMCSMAVVIWVTSL
jgi:hypothetical protein